ncbi:MAG: FecR domain-containing protein [Brevinematales bacterium]|nr:FecR domain-containing protein [Brevinematales bacterium]
MKQKPFLTNEEIELLNKVKELCYVPMPTDEEIHLLFNNIKKNIEIKKKKTIFFNFNRNFVFRFAFASFLILCIVSILLFNQRADKIQLIKYNKDLKIIRNGKVISLKDGVKVDSKDLLINDSEHDVYLSLKNRFVVSISPSSSLFLKEVNSKVADFELKKGKINFWVKKLNKEDKFNVYCENFKVSVVGTIFSLNKINDSLEVSVKEGKVSVTVVSNETIVSEGQSVIFFTNGSKKDFKSDESLRELEDFSEIANLISLNKFVMIHIETKGFVAEFYLNSTNFGKTPGGIFVSAGELFDIEVVGTNGVLRKTGQRLNRDKKYIFSLKDYENKYYINFNHKIVDISKVRMKGDTFALLNSKNAFIIDIKKKEIVYIENDRGEWIFPVIIGEDNILLYNKDGKVESYNKHGQKNWEFYIQGGLWFNADFTFNNEYIAILTVGGGLYILDLNGNLLEQIEDEKTSPGFPMPLVDEKGILYYVDGKNYLVAYNIKNKKMIWSKKLPSMCEYRILNNNENILLYFRDEGVLRFFSKENGSVNQQIYIPEIVKKLVSLTILNDLIYLYYKEIEKENLIVLDSKNGNISEKLTFTNRFNDIKIDNYGRFYFVEDSKLVGLDNISKIYRRYNLDSSFLDFYIVSNELFILNKSGIEKINIYK